MTTSNMAVERLGAEYFQDPDSVHARLRARGPLASVIMPGGTPAWLVTGYADVLVTVLSPAPIRVGYDRDRPTLGSPARWTAR
jgi:hypothetical protein